MVSVTATMFKTLMNITINDEHAEAIIDQAIRRLNAYGKLDMPVMIGTAGSKTVSLSEEECGAVLKAAGIIYANMYISSMGTSGSESFSIGPLNKSSSTSESASTGGVEGSLKEIARSLAEYDVDYG